MAQLTFQVVEGLEAGRSFDNVSTPLTIGREEDNDIQLNDERISRFHAKVQDDSGRVILTDLDSTNGTRVNGHPVRIRILRPGDLIMLGRCVLLVGSAAELKKLDSRLARQRDAQGNEGNPPQPSDLDEAYPGGPPPLPAGLSALQAAELSNALDFIRTEILQVLCSPTDDFHTEEGDFLRVTRDAWQRLELVSPEISHYLAKLAGS